MYKSNKDFVIMNDKKYIYVTGGFSFDGDTFSSTDDSGRKFRVRIYGMDAPEKTQFGAGFATDELRKLVTKQRLQLYFVQKDKYDRYVCMVHRVADDVDVGLRMIEKGMAVSTIKKGYYANTYASAEASAISGKVGLWKAGRKFADPSEFRKNNGGKAKSFAEAERHDRKEKERLLNAYESSLNSKKESLNKVDNEMRKRKEESFGKGVAGFLKKKMEQYKIIESKEDAEVLELSKRVNERLRKMRQG